MKINILTLFPSMFTGPFDTSMLKKAKDNGLVEIEINDIRDWSEPPHHKTDDRPFGGGVGMVMMVEPIYKALKEITLRHPAQAKRDAGSRVVLLSPQGKVFDQAKAREYSKLDNLILIAGHYEGFDERIIENLIDEEISMGDFVLTGGEIPAMAVTDAVVRLLPGVLTEEATQNESFSDGETLDHPSYTRPRSFNGWDVPEILFTGDHKKITAWRKEQALAKTSKRGH